MPVLEPKAWIMFLDAANSWPLRLLDNVKRLPQRPNPPFICLLQGNTSLLRMDEHTTRKFRIRPSLTHCLIRYAVQEPTDDVPRCGEDAGAVGRERDVEGGEELFEAGLEGFDGSGNVVGVPSYGGGAGSWEEVQVG